MFSFTGFTQRGRRTDHLPTCESPIADLVRHHPIKSENIISHIRKATQSEVSLALWAHLSTYLHYVLRQHPFAYAQPADEDVAVNFAELATPKNRVAAVVTQPLTTNEDWVASHKGQDAVFNQGTLRHD